MNKSALKIGDVLQGQVVPGDYSGLMVVTDIVNDDIFLSIVCYIDTDGCCYDVESEHLACADEIEEAVFYTHCNELFFIA